MIDTNIILDVLLRREPFYSDSRQILDCCERGEAMGFVSASAFTDIFYLVQKAYHSSEEAYGVVGSLLEIVNILPVMSEDVLMAFSEKARDFEDCLVATCAKANQCDAVVTRDSSGFSGFDIEVLTPKELLVRIV